MVKCGKNKQKQICGINFAFQASLFPSSTMQAGQLKYMCTLNFKLWLILYFETFHLRYKILEKSIFSGQTNIELSINFILYYETYLPLWILYY